MTVSIRVIALALPAVVGLACAHARSRTAATQPESKAEEQQATAQPGEAKEHEGHQVIMGRVTRMSESSVSIQPILGAERTLEIVPQTTVKVDGRETTPLDIREGQEVRASFDEVDGRGVAVEIESLDASDQGGSGMPEP